LNDGGRRPRFFTPVEEGGEFLPGQEVELPATEAHHAAHVLRLNPGDAVELFDGAGGSALARIVRSHHGEVTAAVDEVRPRRVRARPVIHLAFAVPKGNRLDWLLEKATELGAASLRPVLFERSVAGKGELSAEKRRRWLGHCIAAAKQAGTDFLPDIREPLPLVDLPAEFPETSGFYGDVGEDAVPVARALEAAAGGSLVLVVGPEGGLTTDEARVLREAGFAGVRLGRTTLRIETAAVALLAATVAISDRG
jgi:16S rRNA (uracil1498-N3)-methyltransferase